MDELIKRLRAGAVEDPMRAAGGLLIGLGFVLVAIRSSSAFDGDGIGSFGVAVLLGIPAAFLYGIGVLGSLSRPEGERAGSWSTVFAVLGAGLIPAALLFLVDAIDSTPDVAAVTFVIFSLAAAAAVFAWARAGIRYQLLLGGFFGLIAWLALADKVFGLDDDADLVRILLIAYGVALVVFAFRRGQAREGSSHSLLNPTSEGGELITVAGIAALITVVIGLTGELVGLLVPFGSPDVPGQGLGWDLFGLLSGVGLLVYAATTGLRGAGYVGAVILVLFAYSVGLDLDGDPPEGKILGWPLVVLLGGAALFAYTLLRPDSGLRLPGRGGGGGSGGSAPGAGSEQTTSASTSPAGSGQAPPAEQGGPPPA